MKTVTIRELADKLRSLLAYVRRGGTVRVYEGRVPVAELNACAVTSKDDHDESSLAALERDGILRRGTRALPRGFLSRNLPKAKASVVRALLDERESNR